MATLLLTNRAVRALMTRKVPIPQAETLVFAYCSPYHFPYYDKSHEPMIFHGVKRVVMVWSEKYFADKWCKRINFPDAEEMWLGNVPGGFFEFKRDFPQFVIPKGLEYRGWPIHTSITTDEDFYKNLPKDMSSGFGELAEKYDSQFPIPL
jgi:hypothetical protein